MNEGFLKGCEALGEAIVLAGCRCYFGYPITPSSDLLEYLSWRMVQEPEGVFLQAESEIGAINMVYGAAAAGKRTATGSSGPGISLMQEGISYLCAAELPCVIINISRSGPGLGGTTSSQADYFQATRGGGHGDYRTIVLAPSTVQEMVDMAFLSFDLADKYRNPVLILAEALLGQMYEFVKFPDPVQNPPPKSWALTGAAGRPRNKMPDFHMNEEDGERINLELQKKFDQIALREQRWEIYGKNADEILLVAFGAAGRICKSVVDSLSEQGVRAGLFRPVTLYPFPYEQLNMAASKSKKILVVEMSTGQMIDDVKIALGRAKDMEFYARLGGVVPSSNEILAKVKEIAG